MDVVKDYADEHGGVAEGGYTIQEINIHTAEENLASSLTEWNICSIGSISSHYMVF